MNDSYFLLELIVIILGILIGGLLLVMEVKMNGTDLNLNNVLILGVVLLIISINRLLKLCE